MKPDLLISYFPPLIEGGVIQAPECWAIRPISAGARGATSPWDGDKAWLGQSLILRDPSQFYSFVDSVNALGLRVGVF